MALAAAFSPASAAPVEAGLFVNSNIASCRMYIAKMKMNCAKCLEMDNLAVEQGRIPRNQCEAKRAASLRKASHDSSTGAASTRLIATSTRKPRMQTRPCSYRAAQHANDLPNYNSKYVGHLWGDGRAADCTQAEWEEVVAVASQAGISSLDGQFFGALPVRHPRLGL